MNYQNEAELKVSTINMYKHGRVQNVLDCFISMLETQLIITRRLKEILVERGENERRTSN